MAWMRSLKRNNVWDFSARFMIGLGAVLFCATSVAALQGVIEQTIEMPDPLNLTFATTTIELKKAAADTRAPNDFAYTDSYEQGGLTYTSGAFGYSVADGQKSGEATASVSVYENVDGYNCGNYSNNNGLQSKRTLSESYDADTITVKFTPHDNPYGKVEVELVQKTYVTVWIKFASNDADDQTKYYNFRVANTLIVDGEVQETRFEWTESTAQSSTVGGSAEFKMNGDLQVTGEWSESIDQGTDGFEHLAASRVQSVTKTVVFEATGPGDAPITDSSTTVDCGFDWDLHTTDANSWEVIPDCSVLEGRATYLTVIGFGKITMKKNADGSTTLCPKLWHIGTDLGNPELSDDRTVSATVSYVVP